MEVPRTLRAEYAQARQPERRPRMEEKEEEKAVLSEMDDDELRQTVKVKLAKFVCICCDHPDLMDGGQVEALPAAAKLVLEMLG